MKVTAKFFASYRELLGNSEVEVDVEERATVAHLVKKINQLYSVLPSTPVMIAVNAEYVEVDFRLSDGDEVAFLPPLSGG